MRGKINAINKPIGKKKSAFICLYEPLPNEDNKTPIFFENDLRPGVQFDALTQWQEIEVTVHPIFDSWRSCAALLFLRCGDGRGRYMPWLP